MLARDRIWLAKPVVVALGAAFLFGLGCGGAAVDGELDQGDGEWGGGVGGSSGTTGSAGGNNTGGKGGGSAMGGTSSGGARGGNAGAAGSVAGGGNDGGAGGFAGSGFAGSTGLAGSASAGSAGVAGSGPIPEPSVCVNLDFGLAGLPSQAFPADDDFARDVCASEYQSGLVFQTICLPSPGAGQSCSNFYPENLIGRLYACGFQEEATFVCGPARPAPATDGCVGNECCYVLAGKCPTTN